MQKPEEKSLGPNTQKVWQRVMRTQKPPDPMWSNLEVLSNRAGCLDYVQIGQMLRLDLDTVY